MAAAELVIDAAMEPDLPRFEALPRFPSVVMDMTVEHPEALNYAELESAIRTLAGGWVEEPQYIAPQFFPAADVVRTTVRLVYRHPDRSLTQDEVNAAHMKLREGLAERLGVSFA
jgi:phenylalanyl-tRNA synthetase beta chain